MGGEAAGLSIKGAEVLSLAFAEDSTSSFERQGCKHQRQALDPQNSPYFFMVKLKKESLSHCNAIK